MLYLVFDRVNKILVYYNGSATVIGNLAQTDLLPLQIQFVDPQPGNAIQFLAADESARKPVVTIASKVTGTEGDEATYLLAQAVESAFTWDATNLWFTGTININTTPVAALIGSLSSAPAIFEVDLTTGGTNPECMSVPLLPITLVATAYVTGSTPTPIDGSGGTLALQTGVGGVTIAGTLVTVAGLVWGAIPNAVLIFIHEPATLDGIIFGSYVVGSATVAGFQFDLSAVPANNNYKFTYVPVFNAPGF